MFGSSAASRRARRAQRLLIALQVLLLVFSLAAPAGTIAADSPAPPSDQPRQPPSSDPSADPSTPPADPTPDPTPAPTPAATPDPTATPDATPDATPAPPDPTPNATPEATPDVSPSQTPSPEPTPSAPVSVAPYIVTFVAGTSSAEQSAALADAGATDVDTIAALRMHAVQASDAAVAALRADARVASVELDRSRAAEGTPDDTSYPDQWALPKIGWDQAYGTVSPAGSAVVAVLDTGVDASHPDLNSNIVGGASFVDGSAWNADPNGHGTAMAGIVAAETGNGLGVAGVGYAGVSVMPVTVLGANGLGRDSDIIEGLVWAVDHHADVALMSFSASGYSSALQAAVDYAWAHGVVVVAATGNDGSSAPHFPAGDRGVIGVSSTDASDALSSSSNFGDDTFLAAPGEGILSTAAGGGYESISGTSASASEVAGAAALLHAADGSLSNAEIVGRLAATADPAGSQTETGNGRLNMGRALTVVSGTATRPAGAAPVGSGGPFDGPYVAATVTMTKTAPAATVPGGTFNYVVTASGNGNQGNITITDAVPSGLTVGTVTGSGSGGSSSCAATVGNSVSCTLTSPGNNATYTVTIPVTVTAAAGSTLSNTANGTCTGNCSGTIASNTVSTVVLGPAAKIVLTGANTNLTAGTTRVITATIQDAFNNTTSTGPDAALNVTFTQSGGTGTVTGFGTVAAVNGVATITVTGGLAGSVSINATASGSGGPITATSTLAFTVVAAALNKLGVVVNGGASPVVNVAFTVVIQSQDQFGNPVNVGSNTTVTLTRQAGTGTLGGTLTGTILSGQNTVSILGVTYNKAETGVVIRATRTSGGAVPNPGDSAPFTVNNPTPSTTSISPTSKIVGQATFVLTVNGSGFLNGATVRFAGSARTTTFVNASQLTASIPASDLTSAGLFGITVLNPVPTGAASNAQTFTVNQAGTSTALTSSVNPTVFGQSTTFTATVTASPPGSGTPSGTVSFKDGSTTIGTGTLNGSGVATLATAGLSVGSHSITAVYGGDTNFTTSTSNTASQVVNQAGTSTALTSSVNPTVFGQSTTFTATVTASPPGSGTPSGTVSFKDGSTTIGTGTLNGSGVATLATAGLSVGSHSITAVYGGDTNFTTSTSNTASQVVNQAGTSTALTSSVNPTVFGQSTTFTATVTASPPGSGTPSGTVSFKDGSTTIGTGTLNGSGVATLATAGLSVGSHSITAVYGGDTNFTTSTSNTASQVVNQAGTSTALTSSVNPTVFGQSTTFTATVTASPPGSGTPSGTVSFKDGSTTIGTGTLNGSGVATLATAGLSVGSHSITAVYGGDTNFTTSTSNTASQVVNQAGTSTALTSSVNPTVFGQSTTFTATVTASPPGSGTPSGTVSFKDGSTTIGTGTLNGSGVATLATAGLSVGSHSITAVYGGDTNFTTSTSNTASQVVNSRQTTTSVECSPDTVVVAETTTCTATVTDAESVGSAPDPAGTVAIASDGSGTIVTSPCTLDPGADTTDGVSTCAVSYTPSAFGTGVHNLSADYTANDDIHAASNDADGFDATVHLRATKTLVVCVPSTVVVAEDTTCTVTVTDIESAGTKSDPAGTASLYSDSDGTFSNPTCLLDGGTDTTDGVSTCAVTYDANTVDGGLHTITAGYAPNDDVHSGSGDTTGVVVTVNSRATATSVSCDDAVVVGQAASCTLTVTDTDPAGTKSDPVGTVLASSTSTFGAFTTNPCTLDGGLNTTDGISTCTVTYTPSAVDGGSHTITAAYSPSDDIHTGSSDPTGDPITVNRADTTTTITSDTPDPTVVDEDYTVSWTVTVNGPGAGSPTGNVTVSDGAGGTCTADIGAGACTLHSIVQGAKTLTATYAGDDDFNTSTSAGAAHTVNPRATSTTVSCVPDPIVVSQATTCTATVTDAESAGTKSDPSGTVTFSHGTDPGGFDSTTCSLVGNGDDSSSCAVDYTPTAKGDGQHTIDAGYGGSTVHDVSADTDNVFVTVNFRATTTQVVCDSPVVVGEASTCTATVTDASAAGSKSDPAGTVSFSHGPDAGGFDVASCNLASDGNPLTFTSTCSVEYTPTARSDGSHHVDAAFHHDTTADTHSDSADGDGFDIVVNRADTTTTITSDTPDPTVVDEDYTVSWTVTVNGPGAGSPTGNVTVSDGAGGTCTADIGAGACTLHSIVQGAKTLTATYAGDDDFNTSTSAGAAHTVNPRATSTTVSCVPDPIVVSQATTCTATVTDAESAGTKSDPSGTVTFSHGTDPGGFDSTTCSLVGNGDDSSSCAVDYTPTAKGDGQHTIDAGYGGSTVHDVSADTDNVFVTVNFRATTTSVSCAPASINAGETTSCTATVSDASAAGTKSDPLGNVTFSRTGTGTFASLGTCPLVGNGNGTSQCALTYSVPSNAVAGTDDIDASFTPGSSDADVHSGSSTTASFGLGVTLAANLSITKNDGSTTAVPGTSVTYTIVVGNAGPSDASGATVGDTFPASLSGVTWSAVTAGGATGSLSGSGNINETVTIPVGGSLTYTVHASISSSATGSLSNTATVTAPAGTTDATPGNNTATDADTLTPHADLSITKTDGVASAVPGSTTTYTIVVSNSGPSDAVGAFVADSFPAAIISKTWTATGSSGTAFTNHGISDLADSVTIPSGGSITYVVVATISSAATGNLTNTASVSAPDGTTEINPADNGATDTDTLTPQADLSITKTDGATTEVPGTSVTYTIVVSNGGPSNAVGATVADTFPSVLGSVTYGAVGTGGASGFTASGSGNIADTVNLPAGATITYTVNATISAAATGNLSNTATVTAPAGVTDLTPGNNSATDTDTLTPQADLSITKTDGVTTAVPGSSVTYTIVVSNSGPSNAVGATASDTFPAAITSTWTASQTGGATGFAASGPGNIADTVNLPSGATITYVVHAAIASSATGSLANTATVTAPSGTIDPTPGNNSATDTDSLSAQADLSITKTDGATTAVPGTPVTYSIVVSNSGPSDAVGATVADNFPGSLSGVTWGAITAGGASGSPSGIGNINETVTLPVGATITYTVHATISSSATGSLSNTATVTAPTGTTDATSSNNSATDTDTLTPQADLSITKTDGVTTAVPGGSVTYTIVAGNTGPSLASGASVTDTFPGAVSGTTWTAIFAGGATGNASGSGNLNETVTIPSGGSVTYTVVATISPAATGNLVNTATVAAPAGTTDVAPANNSATDTDTLAPSADLQVTKTGPASATVGSNFAYTIKVKNAGPSNSASFTVTDVLEPEVSFVSSSADCAETSPGSGTVVCTSTGLPAGVGNTVTWTITVSADQAGSPVNIAAIDSTSAAYANDPTHANDSGSAEVAIDSGALFSDVATGDSDWQNQIDGVDVMFTKSGSGGSTNYTLKATNPGTFKYRLSLTNETGIDIHVKGKQLPDIIKRGMTIKDSNGGSTTVFLTVPTLTNNTGTPVPTNAAAIGLFTQPAFTLSGNHAVKAGPNDWSDGLPVTVMFILAGDPGDSGPGTDCTALGIQGNYHTVSNTDNQVARCIRIDGVEIRKHGAANINVNYEFRWKNTASWGDASKDPSVLFRAGFNFKSTTKITLDGPPADLQARFNKQLAKVPAAVQPDYQARFAAFWNKIYSGNNALGLTFAGEKMTAVGGFLFKPSGDGLGGVTVRVFSAPPSADRCGAYAFGTNNLVASYVTQSDGFYFIWQTGDNSSSVSQVNNLPSGLKYYVALCDFTGPEGSGSAMPFSKLYWPARSLGNTLGNKEFDEEDFFVSGPTSLAWQSQSTSARNGRTMGTTKVALLDGFGNVMTVDTGGSTITLAIVSGAGGVLTSATSLTKSLSQGTATWTDLKITGASGAYKLGAASSVSGVPDQQSLPINLTP